MLQVVKPIMGGWAMDVVGGWAMDGWVGHGWVDGPWMGQLLWRRLAPFRRGPAPRRGRDIYNIYMHTI